MKILKPSEQAIEEAAEALKAGLLVAFPTETVYGLGADASSAEALSRLYAAKGRPTEHPVIVHLSSVEQLSDWAREIPEAAVRLAEKLCPGPLTLILPKSAHVLGQVTGGQDSIGLRIPNHPIAQQLLRRFDGGIAAPSANKFGRLSPTTAEDVAHDFEKEVSIVLDGGLCDVGIESTIVDFTGRRPRILRPGMILPEQIEAIIGRLDREPTVHKDKPRAPGTLASHYAPRTPTRLVDTPDLKRHFESLQSGGKRVCVLSFQQAAPTDTAWIVAPSDPARYAHELYLNLRKLDREGADLILVEAVPDTEEWAGIADRLKRASAGEESQAGV